jgi:cyanophycinase
MNGMIALVGAGEYLPVMNDVDRYLLDSVARPGAAPRVVCLPTAAGPEGDEVIERWSDMGIRHFKALNADVQALRIIDRASADDPRFESALESADLIYFSGGNPSFLYETMQGSRAWLAAEKAWARGAAYAGCSAGAMILARRLPNFRKMWMGSTDGFGTVPADYVMPHFDRSGPFKPLMTVLRAQMKDGQRMIGIDENTALVGKLGGDWKAMGSGTVHVMTRRNDAVYRAGEAVPLPVE